MAQSSMTMLLRHDHTYDLGNITFSILVKRSIVPQKDTGWGSEIFPITRDVAGRR